MSDDNSRQVVSARRTAACSCRFSLRRSPAPQPRTSCRDDDAASDSHQAASDAPDDPASEAAHAAPLDAHDDAASDSPNAALSDHDPHTSIAGEAEGSPAGVESLIMKPEWLQNHLVLHSRLTIVCLVQATEGCTQSKLSKSNFWRPPSSLSTTPRQPPAAPPRVIRMIP